MDILDLFRREGEHLFWRRLDDGRVSQRSSGELISPDDAYFQLRLAEMYLGETRTLWRKFSPLVHAFVVHGNDPELHAVAGPGQLQELGEHNLDRVVVLNYRLAGPIPYRGHEVRVLAGLYSVPREDAATALVSVVGALANAAGPQAAASGAVVSTLKSGVDSILGLGATKLRLGVNETFGGGNALRSGFHVGISAPEAEVPFGALWLREGRLVQGVTLVLANPYTGQDYFVLQLERLRRRADWPGLPGLGAHEARFTEILAGGGAAEDKRTALAAAWPAFSEALKASPYLTRYDAGQIAEDVAEDLQKRWRALSSGNPFVELRAWGAERVERRHPAQVDFAAIADSSSGDAAEGERALAQSPL